MNELPGYDVNVPVPTHCWCGAELVTGEQFEITQADLDALVVAGLERSVVDEALGVGAWRLLVCSRDRMHYPPTFVRA